MKTLKEQVQEIMVANTTKATKKDALLKLGITSYEIKLMLDSRNVMGDYSSSSMRCRFTFGVEIECGVSKEAFIAAASQTGMPYQFMGYNHTDGLNFFKFVSDASVHIEGSTECVSPVLQGAAGKKALKNACLTLNKANAKVNRTCGLHVHIGAADLTPAQYANVFANYYHLEVLIDTFMAESRRGDNNQYCKSIRHYPRLQECQTVEDVRGTLRRDRYHKINSESYRRHKTIEFRQHQGTTDYEKIMKWIAFCGKLVVWSKKNRLTSDITSIDEIPFLTKAEKEFFKSRAARLA